MTQFLLALVVFLALHMVPAIPALRARLVAWLGRRNYLLAYSLVSLLALGWLFHTALRLDYIPLWDAAPWQAWFPLVLTPLGFILLFAGLISPNPTSISLRKPDLAPGAITTITRHPVLWGFAFWAGAIISSPIRWSRCWRLAGCFTPPCALITCRSGMRRPGRPGSRCC